MSSAFSNIKAIAKRELGGYFSSPVAYVFIVIFLILTGFFTFMQGNFFDRGQANLDAFFMWHPWLYLFLVPCVGMRLWAEERRVGTMELLLTKPVTIGQAIVEISGVMDFSRIVIGADISGIHHRQLPRLAGQRCNCRRLPRQLPDGRNLSFHQLHDLGHDPQSGH